MPVGGWGAHHRPAYKIWKRCISSSCSLSLQHLTFRRSANRASLESNRPKWLSELTISIRGGGKERKKIAIDPGKKSHMSQVLDEDPELFERYAMEDTKVTLEYLVRVCETAQRVVHASQLPLTLGGAAV